MSLGTACEALEARLWLLCKAQARALLPGNPATTNGNGL
jgi:hypothetical protein